MVQEATARVRHSQYSRRVGLVRTLQGGQSVVHGPATQGVGQVQDVGCLRQGHHRHQLRAEEEEEKEEEEEVEEEEEGESRVNAVFSHSTSKQQQHQQHQNKQN